MNEPTPEAAPPASTPQPPRRGRLPSGFKTVRDVVTFVLGLGVISHEVFYTETAEPASIAVGVALAGLPLVFGADERKAS